MGFSFPLQTEQRANATNYPIFLLKAKDNFKDQSYFLSGLNQSQLRSCLFPLADYTKDEVRQIAKEKNLPTKYRKDSQGLCFLGKIAFDEFISHYLGESPGLILFHDALYPKGMGKEPESTMEGSTITTGVSLSGENQMQRDPSKGKQNYFAKNGNNNLPRKEQFSSSYFQHRFIRHQEIIGKHKGLWYYTIGQRKGITDFMFPGFSHLGPFYVSKKDLKRNILHVTNEWNRVENPRKICYIDNIHWLMGIEPNISHPNLKYRPLSPKFRTELEEYFADDQQKVSNEQSVSGYYQSKEFLVQTKLRHSPNLISAKLNFVSSIVDNPADQTVTENSNKGKLSLGRIELLQKDTGIATGQFAAIYLGDCCVASGTITSLVSD
jgi:tRNA U34 2-thiouridine synthase MnmA/TrmU